jgi:hypothetical protein
MNARRCTIGAIGLVSTALFGCDSPRTTDPASVSRASGSRIASLVVPDSFNLPIPFPTGLTYTIGPGPMGVFYLSTGFGTTGFRETHEIDRSSRTDLGNIPTGGNPRDLSFSYKGSGFNYDVLWFAHEGGYVEERAASSGTLLSSFPLGGGWRGGAIAAWRDTLYVGSQDSSRVMVYLNTGVVVRNFDSGLRLEGMVYDSVANALWAVTEFDSKVYELDVMGNLIKACDSPYHPGPYGLGGIADVGDSLYIAQARNEDPWQGTTIFVIPKNCGPAPLSVNIDIRNGGPGGRIHPNSFGFVQVKLLSSSGFAPSTVIVSSVRFGHSGTEAATTSSHLQDVNGDGVDDLVLWFLVNDTGIVCGDVSATLTGNTNGGQSIKGSASIVTVGCHP